MISVRGEGKTFSYPALILQLSSLLALLTVAINISDVIMLKWPWIKEEHRNLYFANKCANTDDYTSLQEKINLIEQEQAKRLKKIKRSEMMMNGGEEEEKGGEFVSNKRKGNNRESSD